MFDGILNSFLAGFFLILLGVGLYIRFREKFNKIPFREKINELIIHVQKYRYWWLAVAVIVLAPILYYYLDSVFNPPRFKPPPEIHIPLPQPVENKGIDIVPLYFIWIGLLLIVGAIMMYPSYFMIGFIIFSFFVLALTFFVNTSKSKTTIFIYNISVSVFILLSVATCIFMSVMLADSITGL